MMLAAMEAWRCSHTCAWLEWEGSANETFLCCAKTCECVKMLMAWVPPSMFSSNNHLSLCFSYPRRADRGRLGAPHGRRGGGTGGPRGHGGPPLLGGAALAAGRQRLQRSSHLVDLQE